MEAKIFIKQMETKQDAFVCARFLDLVSKGGVSFLPQISIPMIGELKEEKNKRTQRAVEKGIRRMGKRPQTQNKIYFTDIIDEGDHERYNLLLKNFLAIIFFDEEGQKQRHVFSVEHMREHINKIN